MLKSPHLVRLGLVSPVSEHYSAFEYHSVFDELHNIFADTRNGTKYAGYDGIAKSRHCVQGIVVKKVHCG